MALLGVLDKNSLLFMRSIGNLPLCVKWRAASSCGDGSFFKAMAIIPRREMDGYHQRDCEVQEVLEAAQIPSSRPPSHILTGQYSDTLNII